MKLSLAQALRKKAELVTDINTLQARILEGAVYTEGSQVYSAEDMAEMWKSLEAKRKSLLAIKAAIDIGNHVAMSGDTVYNLILTRGELKAVADFWGGLRTSVSQAVSGHNRFGFNREEPKPKVSLSIKEIDSRVDGIRKSIKAVDDMISDLNGKIQIDADI
jgi:hypothetical protein